ncbi:dTDP-4-dehydrorhamnose 3,5-epimerase [Flavonifractor sp. An306]|uniref:dTDP-4-dehydrorhamnose 3,5-epimerase n=1 Tax=Flavonifractor sp. An306 TaxID=1965629 RepID=UPI000B38D791|nr:dTDP-4-dehydrorhamnose 3,5-epimerase [Flavonifractor sp. An306]OUO38224.1 dTDP-4-dehydrorhamnose 3,5-epimerase [Flavonifractor sp. An306]
MPLNGVMLFTPDVFRDYRGWFMESFSEKTLQKHLGVKNKFVQENHIRSTQKGVLRGIHFQNNPVAQSKLIRCTAGQVMDYAIDLRMDSPTYLKWICVELSADNFKQIYIPKGFGHAVVSLTDISEIQYKVDSFYSKEAERSILWKDPQLAIEWPFPDEMMILSEKDLNAPLLQDSDCSFKIKEDEL